MPELPEVEGYRALAAERALGRIIVAVSAPDAWYLKRGADAAGLTSLLVGRSFAAARRRGKLMLLDVASPGGDAEGVLGVHFGMSGRLIVDGQASVERLLYTTGVHAGRHDRFGVEFADGGHLLVRDPRRLGGVEVDPDEDRLGPDALSVTPAQLRQVLADSDVALKARLLDQSKLAGIGNLLADEILWRAGLAPTRPARSLTAAELRRLHKHLTTGLAELMARGGSHMGDMEPERRGDGHCPRDHAELARATVGGRTTWWCPRHQR